MKSRFLIIVALIALTLSSCEIGWIGVPSINTISSKDNIITKPGIEGIWYDTDDSVEFVVTYVDSIGYQVTVNFESNSVNYTAQLVNIEGQTFLDLYPDLYCNSWEEVIGSYGVHALPCHVFAKVSFEKDQMTIAFMNYDKLEKLLADGKLNVKHTYVENHYFGDLMEMDEMRLLLLTASIKDLQEFVYDNPEIFTNQEVLKRAAQ